MVGGPKNDKRACISELASPVSRLQIVSHRSRKKPPHAPPLHPPPRNLRSSISLRAESITRLSGVHSCGLSACGTEKLPSLTIDGGYHLGADGGRALRLAGVRCGRRTFGAAGITSLRRRASSPTRLYADASLRRRSLRRRVFMPTRLYADGLFADDSCI